MSERFVAIEDDPDAKVLFECSPPHVQRLARFAWPPYTHRKFFERGASMMHGAYLYASDNRDSAYLREWSVLIDDRHDDLLRAGA